MDGRPAFPPTGEGAETDTAQARLAEVLGLIERLHRLQLDIVKDEFERLGIADINPVQAMILFNVSHREVTATELRNRGFYQGSNITYNLKRLVDLGYMVQRRSLTDGRVTWVRLTEDGRRIERVVAAMIARHAQRLTEGPHLAPDRLDETRDALLALEGYLKDQIRYIY